LESWKQAAASAEATAGANSEGAVTGCGKDCASALMPLQQINKVGSEFLSLFNNDFSGTLLRVRSS
jgi:hypothetical protein